MPWSVASACPHAMSIIAVRSGAARIALDVRPEQAREAPEIIKSTGRLEPGAGKALTGLD